MKRRKEKERSGKAVMSDACGGSNPTRFREKEKGKVKIKRRGRRRRRSRRRRRRRRGCLGLGVINPWLLGTEAKKG